MAKFFRIKLTDGAVKVLKNRDWTKEEADLILNEVADQVEAQDED